MNCPYSMTQCFDGCTRCHDVQQTTMYKRAQRGGKAGGRASVIARKKKKRAEKSSKKEEKASKIAWMKG